MDKLFPGMNRMKEVIYVNNHYGSKNPYIYYCSN